MVVWLLGLAVLVGGLWLQSRSDSPAAVGVGLAPPAEGGRAHAGTTLVLKHTDSGAHLSAEKAVRSTSVTAGHTKSPATEADHVIVARVVDAEGTPLSGIHLMERGSEDSFGTSGVAGIVHGRAVASRGELVANSPGWSTILSGTFTKYNATPTIVVVGRAIEIAGTVIDAIGRPLTAEVSVQLPRDLWARFHVDLELSRPLEWRGHSGLDGRFHLHAVPAVRGARLVARVGGQLRADGPLPQYTDLRVLLVTGDPDEGLQTDALGLSGFVVDPDGAPVSGVRVVLDRCAEAITGPKGAFELKPGGPCNSHILIAAKHGWLPATVEVSTDAGDGRLYWPTPLILTLVPDSLALSGVVLSRSGPIAGARVWLADATFIGDVGGTPTYAETIARGGDPKTWDYVTTDANGRFRLQGLGDRRYRLAAIDPKTLLINWRDGVEPGGEPVQIPLPEHRLQAPFEVTVVDELGKPIPNVRVRASREVVRINRNRAGLPPRTVTLLCSLSDLTTNEMGKATFDAIDLFGVQVTIEGVDVQTQHVRMYAGHSALEIAAQRTVEVRVLSRAVGRTGVVSFLDKDGADLPLEIRQGPGARSTTYSLPLSDGKTGVARVGLQACFIVLRGGGKEVRRVSIELTPGVMNDVWVE